MIAAERASEGNSAEEANECWVRVNERADEQMAQYATCGFHSLSTHCVAEVSLRSRYDDG